MTRRIAFVGALTVIACLLAPSALLAETVKARVLGVDEKKNEVKVDVAGQPRTYRVDDRSMYRVLRVGRLVIITAELVNGRHTIVDAKAAEQRGRITEFDERQNSVTVKDSETGSVGTFYFDAEVPSRGLRTGDVISFESEERGRRNVITRWSRNSGGGGGGSNRSLDRLSDAGRVYDVDPRRTQVTIDLSSGRRRQTFDVSERRLIDNLKAGDRVEIQYELRGGNPPVITSIR